MEENKFGLIYDGSDSFGTVYIAPVIPKIVPNRENPLPNRRRITLRRFLLILFAVNLIFSLWGFMFLFWPVIIEELRYHLVISRKPVVTVADSVNLPSNYMWDPVNSDFSIIIPKIDARAAIIPNVDAGDESIYGEALKKGVAQAKGTCFPGMNCRMYLFAHSTSSAIFVAQYNAVFYLLRELELGDQIVIYYQNKRILYEVNDKKIVNAQDVDYINNPGINEELILQTCDPPGTTINRLLVFAKPKIVEYLK
ncbi:MAG: sortase [Candidatus Gottesmanbacteria bacterium]